MLVVAVTVAALIALVLALLAVPVVVAVDAELADRLRARWQVQWLFGLVVTGARDAASARPARVRPKPPPAAKPPAMRAARRRRMASAALHTRGLLPRLLHTVAKLLRQVTIVRFQVRAAFGLENPADTGRVYGTLSPMLVAASLRGLDVQCRPMFERTGVAGTLHATIRLRPLALGATVVMLALSQPARHAAVRAWRAGK